MFIILERWIQILLISVFSTVHQIISMFLHHEHYLPIYFLRTCFHSLPMRQENHSLIIIIRIYISLSLVAAKVSNFEILLGCSILPATEIKLINYYVTCTKSDYNFHFFSYHTHTHVLCRPHGFITHKWKLTFNNRYGFLYLSSCLSALSLLLFPYSKYETYLFLSNSSVWNSYLFVFITSIVTVAVRYIQFTLMIFKAIDRSIINYTLGYS